MANTVEFKNQSGQISYINIGKKNNLTGKNADIFNNAFDGNGNLALIDVYGSIFQNGGNMYSYFRHTDIANNHYRFGNLMIPGYSFLDTQKGVLHSNEVATSETPIDTPYQKLNSNPEIYGFGSSKKFVECRFYRDFLTMKEGTYFDLKADPWPLTIYDHQSIYVDASTIFQPSTFSGLLDDKPFLGLGSFDRMFIKNSRGSFGNIPLGYVTSYSLGIRDDGRKEMFFISGSFNEDGKTAAIYYLDGETPIVTDHFSLEADWVHLPYVSDGTCVFKDAIVRFCNKEVHFHGTIGYKGFTEKPRIEKHGQSQVGGTWYEGSVPYQHRLENGGFENMEAFDYKLKAWGFRVLD